MSDEHILPIHLRLRGSNHIYSTTATSLQRLEEGRQERSVGNSAWVGAHLDYHPCASKPHYEVCKDQVPTPIGEACPPWIPSRPRL